LHALEQHPDLLGLIRRRRVLRAGRIARHEHESKNQTSAPHTFLHAFPVTVQFRIRRHPSGSTSSFFSGEKIALRSKSCGWAMQLPERAGILCAARALSNEVYGYESDFSAGPCAGKSQNPPPPPPPKPPPEEPPPPKPDPPELRGAEVITLLTRADIELKSLVNIIG
jgi:hypothetical protein